MRITICFLLFAFYTSAIFSQPYWKKYGTSLAYKYRIYSEAGVAPAPDTIPYIVLCGQSNMAGRAEVDSLPAAYSSYADTINNAFISNNGLTLKVLWGNDPANSGEFGPELLLGDTIAQYRSGKSYQLKYAAGGTYLADDAGSQDWNPQTGERFDQLITYIQNMNGNNTADGEFFKLVAVVWHQGENDAINETYANAYQTNLENFIDSLRTRLSDPDLPVIVGQTQGGTFQSTIETAKRNITVTELDTSNNFSTTSGTRTNTYFYETSDYQNFDGTHYDATWQLEHGRDIFRCLINAGLL